MESTPPPSPECKPYNTAKWNIKKWANKKGWQLSGRDATHLLLDKGKLHVPMHNHDEFIGEIGRHLDNGIKNFITERRTPIFNMHADLDIYQPSDEEMTPERFEEWAREIQSVIMDFFHEANESYNHVVKDRLSGRSFHRLSMLVCTAPSKHDVEKNKKMWTKTGVHLVWPWIHVTTDQAEMIRAAWVQHFQKRFGFRGGHNPWEDVFDNCVYRGNGLRMVGSDKMEPCPACKKKRSPSGFCPIGMCDGENGHYEENRIYRVTSAYDGEGVPCPKLLRVATSQGALEIGLTSIRTTAVRTSPMKLPKWFTSIFYMDDKEKHKRIYDPTPTERKRKRDALGQMEDNIIGAMELGITKAPKLPKKDKRMVLLQKWLRDADQPHAFRVPDPYRKTQIVDMVRLGSSSRSCYYLARTDSSFCLNKRDEHNRNGIYFLINTGGLYQKCFCRCETTEGRAKGRCRDWHSYPIQLPMNVRKAFFPEYHARMTEASEMCFREDLYDTLQLPMEDRIALHAAERESIELAKARINARRKAHYQCQIRSKRDD